MVDASMQPLSELLSLKNKTALITGAAEGIGAAMAMRFAEAGANLYLIDIQNDHLHHTAETIKAKYKVQVKTFVVDLFQPKEIESLWKKLHGKEPDILINNAGIYPANEFIKSSDAFINKVMQVNLGSAMQMCRAMILARGKKGGIIINIGSIEAKTAFKKDLAIYAVSKGGVITLTRSLAREYAEKGFKINALVPGGIKTNGTTSMARQFLSKFRFSLVSDAFHFASRLPIKHVGNPDDVARMAVVLASPISDYMSGSEIVIDGGFLTS